MRILYILLATILLPVAAQAQKDYTELEPTRFSLKTDKIPIYRKLGDTTKVAYTLPKTEEVLVIGQASPKWAVIKRNGFPYYLGQRHIVGLFGFDAATVVGQLNQPLPVDAQTGRIAFTEVVEVPGATQQQLYSRAYEWVVKAYNSANNVVQMQDKESGKIIIKGLTRVSANGYPAGTVSHTLSIYLKDGRYKYVLTDFSHEAPISSANKMLSVGPLEQPEAALFAMGSGKKYWQEIKKEVGNDARSLVAGFKANMAAKGNDPSDF